MPKLETIRTLPSVEYLRECFVYDPASGELRWKERPREHFASDQSHGRWNTLFAGKVAGRTDPKKRHRIVSIDWLDYRAHRVIWKLMTEKEPSFEIDHKNGDGADNCWGNLRAATDGEQRWNSKPLNTNTSGHRGVTWNKKLKKWQVAICVKGFRFHLGLFHSVEEASAVYETAARKAQGEFYRPPQT